MACSRRPPVFPRRCPAAVGLRRRRPPCPAGRRPGPGRGAGRRGECGRRRRRGARPSSPTRSSPACRCHKVGGQGGAVGPDLSTVAHCLTPEQIVESVLWPRKEVKPEYAAVAVATSDGKVIQGYKIAETDKELELREATTGDARQGPQGRDRGHPRRSARSCPTGSPTPMTPDQRRDLVRFLLDLGRDDAASASTADLLLGHSHGPASFAFDPHPLRPEYWPHRGHPVNRDRVYDFYAKEAEFFGKQPIVPPLLPAFPGLDGGKYGHWGNQNETIWADARWNRADLGIVALRRLQGQGRHGAQGGLRPARRRGRAVRLLRPGDALLRGPLARRVRQVLGDPSRLHGRPDPGRHLPPPPRRDEARSAVRLPRVLPARQAGRLRLPRRRRRDARRPLGRGRQVHPRRRPRRGPPARPPDPRRAAAVAAGDRDPGDARHEPALRRRHDRAAVREPLERPPLLRRPRLPRRRHGLPLHDAGRRLAGDRARRDAVGGRAGGGSPRACTRRSAWSSPTAASTRSAATRSPGSTTSTATARPTFTSASATPTSRQPPVTTSPAAWSATRPATSTPSRASKGSSASPPTARRSSRSRPGSATPTAWASRPTAC